MCTCVYRCSRAFLLISAYGPESSRQRQEQSESERPTEAQPEPERQSGHQPETELQLDATRQDRPLASGSSNQPSVQAQQQGTDSQWVDWGADCRRGVVHGGGRESSDGPLLVTTGELETARSRILSLEQDLEMATEELAKMALTGP